MKEVFSVYDVEKKAFSMLSGKYQICIGASVHDLQLKANMEVVGNSYFRNERELFPDYFREQPHGMEISAEQFYQLLGGEPKHDKEKKAWRVYGLRFLSGCGKCLNVWKICSWSRTYRT